MFGLAYFEIVMLDGPAAPSALRSIDDIKDLAICRARLAKKAGPQMCESLN
jgi:hypothetical protein